MVWVPGTDQEKCGVDRETIPDQGVPGAYLSDSEEQNGDREWGRKDKNVENRQVKEWSWQALEFWLLYIY